jgi:hypothetical protein
MGCRINSGRRHSCRLRHPRGWRGRPRVAANAVRNRRSRSPGQRCRPPVARPAGGIARPSHGEPLAPVPHPCSSCFIRSRSGTANSAAIVAASPGVITPPASAEVTASSRRRCRGPSAHWLCPVGALSIGGKTTFTVRSRHGGRMRSIESRIAPGGHARGLQYTGRRPAPARRPCGSSLGLPASNEAAAIVVLLQQPTRRPSGLPDWPV